eukprot:593023-Pleurochrysis_carterae.AAC.1
MRACGLQRSRRRAHHLPFVHSGALCVQISAEVERRAQSGESGDMWREAQTRYLEASDRKEVCSM